VETEVKGRLKEGDKNTKYFYSVANMRRKKNWVSNIEVDGQIVDDEKDFLNSIKTFWVHLEDGGF